MTPEGKRLHDFLTQVIEQTKGKPVPEIGGPSLSSALRGFAAQARQRMAERKLRAAAAVTKFTTEEKNVDRAVAQIESEADEMAQVASEILGNVPPAEEPSDENPQ